MLSSPSKVSVPTLSFVPVQGVVCSAHGHHDGLPAKQMQPSHLPDSGSPKLRPPGELGRVKRKGTMPWNAERGEVFSFPITRGIERKRAEKRKADRLTECCLLDI